MLPTDPAEKKPSPSWRKILHLPGRSNRCNEPGKEAWRDASLPDKERWKEWQKAKDREMHQG